MTERARQELLVEASLGETRVALVEGGRVVEIFVERQGEGTRVGDIFLGRVARVMGGIEAAFVEIGLARAGFLAARDVRRAHGEASPPPIGKLVHEGQRLIVQAIKDQIGEKGLRLTAEIGLPGRYLVFQPGRPGVFVSRQIEDDAERARLATIAAAELARAAEGSGCIVRTAAAGASEADLAADVTRLADGWAAIARAAERAKPPALLFRDGDPVTRALRDQARDGVARIVIDGRQGLAAARAWAERFEPALLDRIEGHAGGLPLFEERGVEAEIEAMASPRVALPRGGFLMIETTEALTAIDVNSGGYARGGAGEAAFRTNLDAAEEIARQLRLRGIGGLIVIDFIHMTEPERNDAVMAALRAALARDRTPVQAAGFSPLGLVEMTRKRVREPLGHQLTVPCAPCDATGRQPSAATIGCKVLRQAERTADAAPGRPLALSVAPDVADWLGAEPFDRLEQLRAAVGAPVRLATHTRARGLYEVHVLDREGGPDGR
jgi:ribonuclease G